MAAPKILVIPGSLRTGSHNAKLAALAAYEFALAGVEVTRLSFADYPLPIYDGDLQAKSGVPKSAVNLKRMIAAHHGCLLVTPEHNSSIPALLKNALDWASRPAFTSVMAYKPVAIMATSPGAISGARCLEHIKVALDSMMARVVLARECIITSVAGRIRDGRLVDETCLDFACGVVEELLAEIRLRAMAKAAAG